MSTIPCTEEGCGSPATRRQWCNKHYRRLLKAGKLAPRIGTCQECGKQFTATMTGPIANRCDGCTPRGRTSCVGCGKEIGLTPRNGWHGSAPAKKYCTDECKPRCEVDGCPKPRRKFGWCSNHYAAWSTTGDAETEPAYRWADERRCLTCGTTDPKHWKSASRKFCTGNCRANWKINNGQVPKSFRCVICDKETLFFDEETRSRMRSDSAYCASHTRHGRMKVTARQLAEDAGYDCKLCGELVDFSIKSPDRRSPSRDHIKPRALGGEDHRSNLQLAHKGCNSSKRHRYIG